VVLNLLLLAIRNAKSRKPPKGIETPWRLHIGHFRKFLFIRYSRRPEGRLLVNQKKMGVTDL
jgi:hypothetical protein